MGRGMGRQAIQPSMQSPVSQAGSQMPPGLGSQQPPQPVGGKGAMPPMHFGPQTPSQSGMSPGNFPVAEPGVLTPNNNNIPILQRPPGLQAQPYPGLQPQPPYGGFPSPNMTPPPQVQPGLPGLLGMQSPDQMSPMQAQPLPFDPQRQQQLMQLAMQNQPSMQDPTTTRTLGDAQYQDQLNFARQQPDNIGIPQSQIQQQLLQHQLMQQQVPMLNSMQKQLEQARQNNLPMADQFKMREDMQKAMDQQNALRQQMLGQQGIGQQNSLKQQTLSQPVQTAQYTSPALKQTMNAFPPQQSFGRFRRSRI